MSNLFLNRLQHIQQLCIANQVDGFYIPQLDSHHNEYIPTTWQRRTWACGFDGSAGDLVILKDQIILWTDGRYTLQAKQQLKDLPIKIIEHQQPIIQDVCCWLLAQQHPYKIAVDPQTVTIAQAQTLQQTQHILEGELIATDNFVDQLWHDQPPLPQQSAVIWNAISDIDSATDKIKNLQLTLSDEDIDTYIITNLDAIAWLFNIRGQDVPFNPVCISYAAITEQKIIWFIDPAKVDNKLKHYCQTHHITLQAYDTIHHYIENLTGTLGLDFQVANWSIALAADQATMINLANPITLIKSQKSPPEIKGMQQAHIADALALSQFFYWLDNHWRDGIDEYAASQKLTSFRQQQTNNQGASFEPISAFADNGAIVHYAPQADTAKTIDDTNLYLLDSGGQYLTGTTDVTRVIHLGTATQQQIDDYTNVLKGHVDLAKAIFPKGSNGTSLDALARQYLWQQTLNFSHGTGHGVGCFLNVHEGPCGITPRNTQPLRIGQVVSNEPGVYRTDQYGIRIENLQTVIPHKCNQFGEFLTFQTLTLFPYALNLINNKLLTPEQRQWINAYHQTVFDTLAPLCNDKLKQWLKNKTMPLQTPAI